MIRAGRSELRPSGGAQRGIDLASDARRNLDQRDDVLPRSMEVDDAGAKHVAAADDCVRDEHLAAALEPIEQRPVERVEMAFDDGLASAARKSGGT